MKDKIKKSAFFLLALVFATFLAVPVFATEEKSLDAVPEDSETTDEVTTIGASSTEAAQLLSHEDMVDFGQLQEKGRTYTKDFLIKNTSSDEQIFRISILPLENNSLANDYKTVNNWLTLVGGKNVFSIQPGEERTIMVRVTLPVDIKGGSYYCVLRLTQVNEQDADFDYANLENKHSGIDDVVNVRLDVVDGDFKYGGKLVTSGITPFGKKGNIRAAATVKNDGTAGFTSNYKLISVPFFGGSEVVLNEDNKEVFAGTEARFETKDGSGDNYGIFRVTQEVSYINAEGRIITSKASRIVISLKPLWMIIIGGVIVLIIALIIVLKVIAGKKKHYLVDDNDERNLDGDNEL